MFVYIYTHTNVLMNIDNNSRKYINDDGTNDNTNDIVIVMIMIMIITIS